MNKRMLMIIEYLINNNGNGVLKDIGNLIKSSERTLRYDIDKINEFLLEAKVGEIYKKSKGELEISNLEEVKEYIQKNFHKIFFIEYREISILISILFMGKINVTHLCEKFDLSRPTIKNDLKNIEKILKKYKLKLIINNKEGLILEGKEADRRRLQLKTLNKHFTLKSNTSFEMKYTSDLIIESLGEVHLNSIKNFIDYITSSIDKIISDEAYSILRNYLLIMTIRIKNGSSLEFAPNQNFLKTTDEFKYISKAILILEASYKIEINKFEISNLTDYFLGSHSYNLDMSFYENWIEIETLVKEIIDTFGKKVELDLSKDKPLFDGLLNHIKPTIHRVKNNIELKNSIYSEVLEEYPELFKATQNSIKLLEEFVEKKFPNDEVAFLVVHFKGAVDRNLYQKKEVQNILVVCGEGLGTSKLIEQQLYETFDINVVDTIPLNKLDSFLDENTSKKIDLILTTVKIDKLVENIPVVFVKAILTKEELKKLEEYNLPKYNKKILLSNILKSLEKGAKIEDEEVIIEELKKHLGNKLIDDRERKSLSIFDMLALENIEINVKVDSWEEAIERVGENLYKTGYVSENYGEDMKNTIKKHCSYIVITPNFAIPHGAKKYVKKSGMSLLSLSTPVIFPGDVQVNTILAFSSVESKEHLEALSKFINMVNKYDFINKSQGVKSPKKILEIIQKYDFLVNLGKQNI